uniref:Uncharacterized protein n=1 Tax=Oryza brachyantha TaxID=4533 RepID=J3L432_ORYBR
MDRPVDRIPTRAAALLRFVVVFSLQSHREIRSKKRSVHICSTSTSRVFAPAC